VLIPRSRIAVASFFGASYYKKVLGTEPADLIGYWPLSERSGSVADNLEGTAARDGAYTGVTLGEAGIGDGWPAPYFDGANDYCNIYSASLAGAFDGAEGTMALWVKPADAGVWVDGTQDLFMVLWVDANNSAYILKETTSNRCLWRYEAGGSVKSMRETGISSVDWQHFALTWSASADQTKAYLDGVQVDSTQTGLGVWAGSLFSSNCVIGGLNLTPSSPWPGYLAHAAVWTKALTAAQVLNLGAV
jgi:hypothetical protein